MPGSLTTPNGIKYFTPSDTSSWSNGINPALLKIDELVTELKDADENNLNQLTEEITGVANRTTSLESAMGVAQGNINSNASAVSNINATLDIIVSQVNTNETAVDAINESLSTTMNRLNFNNVSPSSDLVNNLLLITSTEQYGANNKTKFFNNPATNSPVSTTPFRGVRKVYVYDPNNIQVELIEFKPTQGRRWYNFYDGSGWSGWKSSTPV